MSAATATPSDQGRIPDFFLDMIQAAGNPEPSTVIPTCATQKFDGTDDEIGVRTLRAPEVDPNQRNLWDEIAHNPHYGLGEE